MRALVAEDNTALARVLALTLRGRGFDVETALDGEEAWRLAQRSAFDLLVSDQQMPGRTGLELVQLLRDSELNRDTPVVLLTAKGMELDAQRIRDELGVEELMMKPFSPTALGDVATRVCAVAT